ncbi:MAG: hypothetical protein K6T80_04840 [Firmicutes bacterium]|nr:hypothetical protein [Bacillota bacterium]
MTIEERTRILQLLNDIVNKANRAYHRGGHASMANSLLGGIDDLARYLEQCQREASVGSAGKSGLGA